MAGGRTPRTASQKATETISKTLQPSTRGRKSARSGANRTSTGSEVVAVKTSSSGRPLKPSFRVREAVLTSVDEEEGPSDNDHGTNITTNEVVDDSAPGIDAPKAGEAVVGRKAKPSIPRSSPSGEPVPIPAHRTVSGGAFHRSPAFQEPCTTDHDYMENQVDEYEEDQDEHFWRDEEVHLPTQPRGLTFLDDDATQDDTDIRKELIDMDIKTITYSLLKPGKVYEHGFNIPTLLSWDAYRKMLVSEFGLEQAVQDGAEFQFALNKTPNQWIVIKSDDGWVSSVLHAVLSNLHDRSAHRFVGRGRKKEIKDALPLVVRVKVGPKLKPSKTTAPPTVERSEAYTGGVELYQAIAKARACNAHGGQACFVLRDASGTETLHRRLSHPDIVNWCFLIRSGKATLNDPPPNIYKESVLTQPGRGGDIDTMPADIRLIRRSSHHTTSQKSTGPASESSIDSSAQGAAPPAISPGVNGVQRVEICFPGFPPTGFNGQAPQPKEPVKKVPMSMFGLLKWIDDETKSANSALSPSSAATRAVKEFSDYLPVFLQAGFLTIDDLLSVKDDIASGGNSPAEGIIELLGTAGSIGDDLPTYIAMARILQKAASFRK